MNDIAIKVENLGKMYRIGAEEKRPDNLWQATKQLVTSPFDYLRRITRPPTEAETLWALRDVSFEVKRGEVVGIIGRNGAGKSTLLKIISRITEPTHGRAVIHGRVGSLLEVGTGFHPELTGRENIYLNGAILGMKREEIDRKFDEIVDFSGVERFLDTPVKRYSSGMHVRLGFAVAAHLEPEILLVDEVLAVGDVEFQKKCLGKMRDVAREGRTVLFVSHNMAVMRKLCKRVLLLGNGYKLADDKTDAVIRDYLMGNEKNISENFSLPSLSADEPARGLKLYCLGADNKMKTRFYLDEKWKIVLEFELTQPLAHFIAAVGLIDLQEVPIITYWSQPANLEPGHYKAEFVFDVPLTSCDLQFVVGLSSYERAVYYLSKVGRVSITEVAQGEQPLRSSGTGFLSSTQRPVIKNLS